MTATIEFRSDNGRVLYKRDFNPIWHMDVNELIAEDEHARLHGFRYIPNWAAKTVDSKTKEG